MRNWGVVAAASVGLFAVLVNLVVAAAPSTKIDELYYHMLVGKRIAQDGGLLVYQEPWPAGTAAQMLYQIAQGIFHRGGMMDAGNLVSWAFSVALFGLVGLLVARETGRAGWGAGIASCGAVGLYATVWHTTAGAHAIGDLTLFAGMGLALFGEGTRSRWGDARWMAAIGLCAGLAAGSKISIWPTALAMFLLAAYCRGEAGMARRVMIGILPGAVLLLPLLLWSWVNTGSPLGPVGAGFLGPSVFAPEVVAELEATRRMNQYGLLPVLRHAAISVSPVFGSSLAAVAWFALRSSWRSRVVVCLFAMQSLLIALFLTHDFRFLGGLQYVVLVVAAIEVWEAGWVQRWFRWRWVALGVLTLPWLGTQVYYAKPFASAVFGLTSKDAFPARYVAFHRDFQALARVLPENAVLLIEGYRAPGVYAPRPVVYTVLDWDGARPLYRMRPAGWTGKRESEMRCGEVAYGNEQAVVETYRTPGKAPLVGAMVVERCEPDAKVGRVGWERR